MAERLKQIAGMHIGKHMVYSDADRRGDEARGQRDGERNFPALTDPHNPILEQVLAQTTADFSAYEKARREYLAELTASEAAKRKERDEELVNRRRALLDEKQQALGALSKQIGPDSPQWKDLAEKKDESAVRLRKLEAELARPLRVSMVWFYPILMVIVCLAEVPVNRMAFEFFFQETPVISLGISLVVGLVLASFAHFIGLWLKQANQHEGVKARLSYYGGSAFLAIMSFALVYFIAAMREHFLRLLEADSATSFADLLRSGGDGLASTAAQVATVELGAAGWTLLIMNLVILTIAAVASFVRHDPHPDYEKLHDLARKFGKRFAAMQVGFNKKLGALEKKYDEKISAVERQIERVEQELDECRDQQRAAVADYEESLRQVGLTAYSRIINYRTGNLRARSDGTPASLAQIPSAQDISHSIAKSL